MSHWDSLVSSYEQTPVRHRPDAAPLPQRGFVASAHAMAIKANTTLPAPKRIHADLVDALLERISDQPEAVQMRAVAQFVNTIENPNTQTPTEHRDLLPRNHPLSTQWISSFNVRAETAEYYATHPKIEDSEVRGLLASAVAAEPDTVERKFYAEALLAKTNDVDLLVLLQEADTAINIKLSNK